MHPRIPTLVNLEDVHGDAKPYQVGQVVMLSDDTICSREWEAMSDHHINVFHSDEDDGWIADIPDLDGCSAFGPTAEESLAEVLVAKTAWVEAARARGLRVPVPRYRPQQHP